MRQIADRTCKDTLNQFHVVWLLPVFILCLASRPAAGEVGAEKLVPAQFQPFHNMTDSQGFQWDFNQFGMVQNGTDQIFRQAFFPVINGGQYRTTQAMMTADGSELVLQGNAQVPGLEITRRCRVDAKSTGARFTEVFTNRGATPLNLSVDIFINPGGNGDWQTMLGESGQANPAALGKQETGVVLYGPVQNGTVSLVLYLAGPKGAVRPTIHPFGNGQPGFAYSLSLPPQKTAAIVYGAAQCRLNDQPDAKAVAALLKPFSSASWVKDLPGNIRRSVVNLGGFSGDISLGGSRAGQGCWPCWRRTPARPISWPLAAARG